MCESIVRELDDQMAVMRANTEEQNRETSFSSALSKLPLVSGLTRQLYGVLAWMGALVPSRSMVVQQREEVEVR